MKRHLYSILAAWCLFQHAKAGIEDSIISDGVTYQFYSADSASSLITDGDPCGEGVLANWESEAEYKQFIDTMESESVATGNYHIGVIKHENTVYLRTYTGGRLVPVTNSYLTYGDKTANHCVQLEFDTDLTDPKFRNFYKSPWTVGNDCDLDVDDLYICMLRTDAACTELCAGTLNVSPIIVPDRQFGTCFWEPTPGKVFTHTAAMGICSKYGGHLMNLLEASDLIRLNSLINQEQSWNRYWLGLIQESGESHPHWTGESFVFIFNLWEIEVNYGSALNSVPYAGLWDVGTGGMDLWMTAPFVESEGLVYDVIYGNRDNREAFVLCEAAFEKFCLKNSPDVAYAIKTAPCCNKVVYTCRDEWQFPDGTQQKDIPCMCGNTTFSDEVPDCVLIDRCQSDPSLCGPHGHCISTNRYPDPYYCLCKKGFSMSPSGQCVDVNECDDNPCGVHFGQCINTEGAYWCQCTQGYGWDTHGQCKAVDTGGGGGGGPAAVHTMTIYFYVHMGYNPRVNEQDSDRHNHIKAALDDLAMSIYGAGNPVTVDSFLVVDESGDKIKIRVVFNIYVQADVTSLSVYAWKFYNYVRVTVTSININGLSYPYYGSVYLVYGNKDIEITSLCSIYDDVGQCRGSPCRANAHGPQCVCHVGYSGDFCEGTSHEVELSDVEIGLIAAVSVLFLLVLCMPLFIWCCYNNSCRRPRSYGKHQVYGPTVLRAPVQTQFASKWRYHN